MEDEDFEGEKRKAQILCGVCGYVFSVGNFGMRDDFKSDESIKAIMLRMPEMIVSRDLGDCPKCASSEKITELL